MQSGSSCFCFALTVFVLSAQPPRRVAFLGTSITCGAGVTQRFLPIVKKATAKVQLADKYNEYAQKGVQFGLVKKEQANLDDYVTQKTLDGLFYMVAEEEKKIRQDPVKAGSDIIKKVFGALQK